MAANGYTEDGLEDETCDARRPPLDNHLDRLSA